MFTIQGASDKDLAAAYRRHFVNLSALAENLNVPPEQAESLIDGVLMATLGYRRPAENVDQWLAAALTYAVQHRETR